MAAKSPEARRVVRELEKELAEAAIQLGQDLHFSASEQAILGQISTILDRKTDLLALYEHAEDVKTKVKLSAEVRLLEQAASRMVEKIKTDLPAAPSRSTVKARRAANARWSRAAG